MKKTFLILILLIGAISQSFANKILIPMDESQKNHLKGYGIAFWILKEHGGEIDWLLNYRGGSFMFNASQTFINECVIRGVSYEMISDADAQSILNIVSNPDANMDAVKLNKAPKIAVYTPKTSQPWDDAVTLVLTYAEIPFEKVFDEEVMDGKLPEYDWLHLHHEDFTGQYGKFLVMRGRTWYQEQKREAETIATKYGFQKVSQLKLAVSKKIRDFVVGGGYMFAMCNATDTFDIALAADGVDIVESVYDGDGADSNP
nr:asparagine synthetase B [Spirosomataceae bacterium]